MRSPQPSRCASLGRPASQGWPQRFHGSCGSRRGLHRLAGYVLPPKAEGWREGCVLRSHNERVGPAEATSLLSGFHIARKSGERGQGIRLRVESCHGARRSRMVTRRCFALDCHVSHRLGWCCTEFRVLVKLVFVLSAEAVASCHNADMQPEHQGMSLPSLLQWARRQGNGSRWSGLAAQLLSVLVVVVVAASL